MAVEPISIRQMETQTADVYEAVVVMSQRARQVAQNRAAEKALYELDDFTTESYDQMMEEESSEYEEKDKATTVAITEFIEGDLKWRNADLEEDLLP